MSFHCRNPPKRLYIVQISLWWEILLYKLPGDFTNFSVSDVNVIIIVIIYISRYGQCFTPFIYVQALNIFFSICMD